MSERPIYDTDNVFAKILRGEIPCTKVFEDDHVLAFKDIAPRAPTHILVIPKGAYVDWDDFSVNADAEEIVAYIRAVGQIARDAGVNDSGYRLIVNKGPHGVQEVFHLHTHIMGGRPLGPMLSA